MPGVIMGPAGPPLDGDARARVAEGEDGDAEPLREDEGDDALAMEMGASLQLPARHGGGRLPPHLVRSPRLHLHRGAVRRVP